MTTLANAEVGDKVLIEFEVMRGPAASAFYSLKNSAWTIASDFVRTTEVKTITKGPTFKPGDFVKASTYVSYRYVTKTGTVKFVDNARAWVSWDKTSVQAAHESLMKLSNLSKA